MTSWLLVVATMAGGLLAGLIPTLIDSITKPITAKLSLPSDRADWFVRLFYLAWLPGMPLAGWLLDQVNTKEILFFGFITLILGLTWLALAKTITSLLLSAVLLGLANSLVTVATVQLMTQVYFPEFVRSHMMNIASLNLGFAMVGLGALIGPWIATAIENWGGYRQGLLYLSAVLIAPASITALCSRAMFPRPAEDSERLQEVFQHPYLALIAVVILLYFALENFLEYWPEAFLKEIDYHGRSLQASLIVFWLVFIGARLTAAWWLYHHPSHGLGLTILLVIGSGCVLGNLAGGFNVGSSTFGFWLAGACYGPLLPGLLGIALDFYHPQALPVAALGALLALSGLDTLVLRPVMDVVAKDRPARSLMRAPTVLAFVLAAPLLLLAFLRN